MSEESTACDAPSLSVTETPVTGAPMSAPLTSMERKPFSTAEMNSFGIDAAADLVGEAEGLLRPRFEEARTLPYWPEPPVCFLCM